MGVIMFAIHGITVLCVAQLPETKGSHMGGGHHSHEPDDLILQEEEAIMDDGRETTASVNDLGRRGNEDDSLDGSDHRII